LSDATPSNKYPMSENESASGHDSFSVVYQAGPLRNSSKVLRRDGGSWLESSISALKSALIELLNV
jgi:hypothetical protein